eukprot:CAMPEP_0196674310 /NCGR_PEP_ID=MMETSP1090-20130531/3446_1 /TAXON_ID=37098 /ORGANISM="Isochrysis sp, Strain CCMP1244" /LENGTH=289 /DNA_ID=CAMNT_0042012113 /DNA_START=68 /DNA_END=933 /DNA_ORIENTATION=+
MASSVKRFGASPQPLLRALGRGGLPCGPGIDPLVYSATGVSPAAAAIERAIRAGHKPLVPALLDARAWRRPSAPLNDAPAVAEQRFLRPQAPTSASAVPILIGQMVHQVRCYALHRNDHAARTAAVELPCRKEALAPPAVSFDVAGTRHQLVAPALDREQLLTVCDPHAVVNGFRLVVELAAKAEHVERRRSVLPHHPFRSCAMLQPPRVVGNPTSPVEGGPKEESALVAHESHHISPRRQAPRLAEPRREVGEGDPDVVLRIDEQVVGIEPVPHESAVLERQCLFRGG